jgi:hypothetical protein
MEAALRQLIAIGAATILSIAGVASAQNSTPQQGKGPGKTSLPTTPIFRGGFQRPIFQGGFARIMPTVRQVPTTTDPSPAPTPSSLNQVLDDNDLLPNELQAANPGVNNAPADTRLSNPGAPATGATHTHAAGECTGDCANDPDHHHDAKAESKAPLTQNAKLNDLLTSVRTPEKPAAGTFDKAAFDRANKPGAGSAPSCVACHTDKSKFVKKDPAVDNRPKVSARELARAFEKRNDMRLTNMQERATSPMPAAMTASSAHEPMDQSDQSESDIVGRAPGSAVEPLRDHLKDQPDDFHAMRRLALALLGSKHAQEAADMMAKAYEADPLLCKEPIDTKALGLDKPRLMNLVKLASEAARQSNTSKAWLLATVLYQAQGSQSQALSALDNARHAGLNSDVSDWFAAELKRKPERLAEAAK